MHEYARAQKATEGVKQGANRREWPRPCQGLQRSLRPLKAFPSDVPGSTPGGVVPLGKGYGHFLRDTPCRVRFPDMLGVRVLVHRGTQQ